MRIAESELIINSDGSVFHLHIKPEELADTLKKLACKPRLVVTDSQVFPTVAKIVPENVPLTSFSILMARYKGSLLNSVKSVKTLENIQDGDKIRAYFS